MRQDHGVGRDGGGDATDDRLVQGPQHAPARPLAVGGPHHQLGHEVVVVLTDGVPGLVPGVEPHARAARRLELGDGAGRGHEASARGVLSVDAHLDGVPVAAHLVLGEAERLARRHPQLPLDEVEAGHELGHGVLDLQPGVHLQEEELSPLEEELHGAGVDVVAGLGDGDRRLAHGAAHVVGEFGGRALFHQLLVAPLWRAVALAEPDGVAVGVGHDLHLDVARPVQVLLDVDLGPAEVRPGPRAGPTRTPLRPPRGRTRPSCPALRRRRRP